MHERFVRLAAGTLILGTAVIGACSKKVATDPNAACGDYFEAEFRLATRCSSEIPNDAEAVQRLRSRFLAACKLGLAIHGTGVTPDWLEGCAASLDGDGCGAQGRDPACVAPPGSLAPGAMCSSSLQCGSTFCQTIHVMDEPDVCGPLPIAIGAPCERIGTECVTGAQCEDGTCVALLQPAKNGLGCDQGSDCKSGVCDGQTKVCRAPEPAGTACAFPFDCATGLACIKNVCAPQIGEGGACETGMTDTFQSPGCGPGLLCDPAMQVCVAIHFAQAGQACDDALTYCEIGTCNVASTGGNGTCPQVIADGAACLSAADATCDSFAECIGGTCVLSPSPAFR
ncbi:MAG: hypothetical protein ABIP39_04035 [Polyangiaceae bacterium]